MPVTQPSRHAAIIDAGSSGSRLYVYQWPSVAEYRILHDGKDDILNALPPIKTDDDWSIKTHPGISSFASKSEEQIWTDHLEKLITKAQSIVPQSEHCKTPIYFLATAGMRLLEDSKREALLTRVCSLLQNKSNFYVPECASHVNVIDGETEGLYGWLALNYLIDPTQTFTSDHETFGFMDMGGASSQIAFMPNATESKRHEEDLFRVSLRTVGGDLHKFDVFVSTWLGFGANEGRRRLLNDLQAKNKGFDPCTSKGLTMSEIKGTGNFQECLKEILPLLNKGLPCKDDPCLFNGVHVPTIDFAREKFVGVSEYWYTAHDVFKMGGKYDFYEFTQKAEEFCGLNWETVLEKHTRGEFGEIPSEYLQHACFKAAWVVSILHEGFNVPFGIQPGGSGSKDESADPQVESSVKPQDLLYDDPFQSALSIHGKELSWTLGRAMLYASSEVAPRDESGLKEHPGFLPAGSTLFIQGGEISTGPALKYGGTSWHLLPLAMLSIIVVLILVIYRARHKLPYRKRLTHIWMKIMSLFMKNGNYDSIDRLDSEAFIHDLDLMESGQMGKDDLNNTNSTGDLLLRSYPTSPTLQAVKNKRSYPQLGKSTSMLNLSRGAPSRVSSRLNMRADRSEQ